MQGLKELPRTLGLVDALAIVIGVVIGGGIFLVPNLVARNLSDPASIIGVWVFAGVASFFGALACAELGAALPSTGGQYVFLREIYGPMTGFLCGWSMFMVGRTAQVSWLAVILSFYVSYFVPLTPLESKLLGIGTIALFAAINYRGVSMGALVQKAFTSAKLIGLLIIIGSALLYRGSPQGAAAGATIPLSLGHFGVALVACLLCYDGWVQVTYVAGEIKNPNRNILWALAGGVGAVILIYVSANLAYLHVLSIPEIAASEHVGATAAERTLGASGGKLVAVVILLSIIGGLNGCFLTSPRVFFAQARDGLFFSKFAEVHPRYQTPSFAIVAQAGWSIVLLVSGTYETLIDYAMMALWIFYALMVLGVILLRRSRPDLTRPYKMWGYPVTPVFFVAVATFFIVNAAISRPAPSLASLGLVATGVPVYFLWRKKQEGQAAEELPARTPRRRA